MTDELLTKEDVAKRFGKKPGTVMMWVKNDILKGHKVGGSWFFRKEDVEALTRNNGRRKTGV